MRSKITHSFRTIYFIGLVLLFFSLFLEWYSFQIYNFDNELLVSWSYHFFSGWITPFSDNAPLNEALKPVNSSIPFIINILLIIVLVASGYIVILKNVDQAKNIKSYNKYGYVNGFLLLLVAYYLIMCPVMYLIPNELYYPLLNVRNYDAGLIKWYAIGPSYILQLISFPLIFPYSVFYFKTVSKFIQQERAPNKIFHRMIQDSQELLDLDQYIAEEELNQDFDSKTPKEDINNILTTFIEGKN
ncbi:MAG: hypothetical protein ACFE9S_04340 [Candidatus Hermodarchaeota archaeon]